jgi:hypothetical protein
MMAVRLQVVIRRHLTVVDRCRMQTLQRRLKRGEERRKKVWEGGWPGEMTRADDSVVHVFVQ